MNDHKNLINHLTYIEEVNKLTRAPCTLILPPMDLSRSSQVVEGLSEVSIVVQLLQVDVIGLLNHAMGVETVMVFSDLVSVLTWSWYFNRS